MNDNKKQPASTLRNQHGEELTPGYFWDRFDNYVSELYSGAEHEAQDARRLLEHETPTAVEAAVWLGVITQVSPEASSLPMTQERISHAPVKLVEAFTSGHNIDGVAAVMRVGALHLTIARCEATMRQWANLYWFFRADSRAINFNNATVRAALIAQFGTWLYASEARRGEWEKSGLHFNDLLFDGQMVECLE
jgi:hypothetical protein